MCLPNPQPNKFYKDIMGLFQLSAMPIVAPTDKRLAIDCIAVRYYPDESIVSVGT
jgi:hypothetical protein